MPKGVKQGSRRGPYLRGGKEPPASIERMISDGGPWTDADDQHCAELIAASPLASVQVRAFAARRATELARVCRELDGRPCTVEELKVRVAASGSYRKWLETLRVADKVKDEDGDL